MNALFWPKLLAALVPILVLISPGIAIVRAKHKHHAVDYVARVFICSLSCAIFVTFVLSFLHLSVLWYVPVLIVALIIGIKNILRKDLAYLWGIGLLIYFLFSLPFLYIQQGLPAGDSQKSIYWANQILATNQLPNYQSAIVELSRDPVDFFTPGLHSLTALLMSMSPLPLTTVGFFSVALGVAALGVALAISKILYEKEFTWPLGLLTAFFLFTQYRFLRYIDEPGYHLQNIVGEVLLFGILYITLLFFKKWRWADSVLLAALLFTLAITHQFSTFIAAFMLAPVALVFVLSKINWKKEFLFKQLALPIGVVVAIAAIALAAGLQKKIPHLFTATPHLLDQVPDLFDYPKLMGMPWLMVGIAGLLVTLAFAIKSWRKYVAQLAFVLSVIVIFILSQGPRIFIDIPAVRALLYLAIPLSITGAYFIYRLIIKLGTASPRWASRVAVAVLLIVILTVGGASLTRAYNISHTVRTDASLSPELSNMNSKLSKEPGRGGILTDDYNQQATSWLLLAGKPMFTRVSSDLARQMSESRQSKLRYQLYLDQLDFDKIFSLGSLPIITQVMDKHNIEWVTGIDKSSSYAFAHNPALTANVSAAPITLFKKANVRRDDKEPITPWLLRASTLANDIGDDEDTYEHLPASLRTSRLSGPQFDGQRTYRTTTAPLILMQFNIDDYVRVLWDKARTGQAESTLEFKLQLTQSPRNIKLITANGREFPISSNDVTIRIPAKDAMINDEGFVTLALENPAQQAVGIDLIALGLGHTP